MENQGIKIKERKSKLWGLWKIMFPNVTMESMYLAFGDTIYIPEGKELPRDTQAHEMVHLYQQGLSKKTALIWWVKYVFSKKFRYRQEIEAYREQFDFAKRNSKMSYKKLYAYRNWIVDMITGKMYGNMATREQALKDLDI